MHIIHHKRDVWSPQGHTNMGQSQVRVTHDSRAGNGIVITLVITIIAINKNELFCIEVSIMCQT